MMMLRLQALVALLCASAAVHVQGFSPKHASVRSLRRIQGVAGRRAVWPAAAPLRSVELAAEEGTAAEEEEEEADAGLQMDSQMGGGVKSEETGDELIQETRTRTTSVMDDAVMLRDKPLLSFGIVVGTLVLFLGLGRLPALFWLIGWSAAADEGFKTEIIELFEGKGLNNASDTLKQSLLLLVLAVFVALAGEASLSVIKPLTVTNNV
mmetsp:Transcript_11522/g.24190  ORF Transcript_11522/g.24190 Transcript_11522/m.24190 type:complete len:209 (-) Transcript_11522:328-954(-)